MEIRVTIAIHLADIFNLGPSVSWPAKLHQRGAHVLGGPPRGRGGGIRELMVINTRRVVYSLSWWFSLER